MRELTESLVGMKLLGQEGTAEYQAMSDKLATLKDAMGDVNQQTQALASDTKRTRHTHVFNFNIDCRLCYLHIRCRSCHRGQ